MPIGKAFPGSTAALIRSTRGPPSFANVTRVNKAPPPRSICRIHGGPLLFSIWNHANGTFHRGASPLFHLPNLFTGLQRPRLLPVFVAGGGGVFSIPKSDAKRKFHWGGLPFLVWNTATTPVTEASPVGSPEKAPVGRRFWDSGVMGESGGGFFSKSWNTMCADVFHFRTTARDIEESMIGMVTATVVRVAVLTSPTSLTSLRVTGRRSAPSQM